jgi:hypothetical protein
MSNYSEWTVDALKKEWDVLAMMCDDNMSEAYIWDNEDAQSNIEAWEQTMNQIEAELNRRGIGLNGDPIGERHEDREHNGVVYRLWVKHWVSTLGNIAWGVTNMQTGIGGGGFTQTLTEAYHQVDYYIQPEAYEESESYEDQ